jgi:hypothetical protein
MAWPLPKGAKLASCDTVRKLTASLSIRDMSHATIQHRLENCSLILNGRAFEYVIASVDGGLLCGSFWLRLLVLMILLPCLRNNVVGLMAELRS